MPTVQVKRSSVAVTGSQLEVGNLAVSEDGSPVQRLEGGLVDLVKAQFVPLADLRITQLFTPLLSGEVVTLEA